MHSGCCWLWQLARHLVVHTYMLKGPACEGIIRLQHPVHMAHLQLLPSYVGFASKMAEWLAILDKLEIPEGAVAGLSTADKPTIEGRLLQLPAGDRALFFRGQHLDVLKRLRTLLPDVSSGEATLELV